MNQIQKNTSPSVEGLCVFAFYGKREKERNQLKQAFQPIASRCLYQVCPLTLRKYIKTEKMPALCTLFLSHHAKTGLNHSKTPFKPPIPTNKLSAKPKHQAYPSQAAIQITPHTGKKAPPETKE